MREWDVILVYPDTNAMWGDPFLTGQTGTRLLDALANLHGELHISPVVAAELQNRIADEVNDMVNLVAKSARKASKLFSFVPLDLIDASAELGKRLFARGEALTSDLLNKSNVYVDPFPPVSPGEIVARAVSRRRPYLRSAKGVTSGQNDVMIWEGLKVLLQTTPADVVFVTKDRGFRGRNGALHPELSQELESNSIDANRIVLADSLHRALAECLALPNRERRQAMLDYMWGLASDFPNFAFGWVRDRSTGECEEGEYPLDIDPSFQDVRLLNIVNLENGYVGPADPAIVTLDVRLDFEAWVRSANWRNMNKSDASIRLIHPNSGAVTVGFSRRVRLSARGIWNSERRDCEFVDGVVNVDVLSE
jgi:PIN domain